MFDWLKKKSADVTEVTLDRLADIGAFARYGVAAGVQVNPKTAVEVTAVMCAVKVISEGIAQMPLRIMRETRQDGRIMRQADRAHWAHRLLAVRPNGFQTPFEFREYAITAALLDGAFVGVKDVVRGEVREVLPLPMGSWSIHRDEGQWSHYFRVGYANGTSGEFAPEQVVYLRGPSLDGWRSLPAIAAAREAIGLSRVMEKQQARLASNGGKPSGVLAFEETLSPEVRESLRESWQDRFGPNGEGGIAILDRMAKFQSMTMTSVDAQYIETRQFQIEEIARAFRVHPIMLMQSNQTTTFASAEQHFRHHVVHTLGPWIARMEDVFDRDILRNDPALSVDLDERALLRGDFKDQAEYYVKALGAGGQPGWLTQNEIRAELGLNPVAAEWADEVPRGAMGLAETPVTPEDDGPA
jgi:HK97 family phage portal protein